MFCLIKGGRGSHTEVIRHQLLALQRLLCAYSHNWRVSSQRLIPRSLVILDSPFSFELENMKQRNRVAEDILNVDVAKGEGDEEDL